MSGRTGGAPAAAAVIVLLLIGAILVWLAVPSGSPRTSVLLVVIDTLRADALGCYGSRRGATPNLDALAAESVRFSAAYSQSPWTLPSFASLFTSAYPGEHGAVGHMGGTFYPMGKDLVTAAQSFREHGYRTAAIVNNIFLNAVFGFQRGFDTFDIFPAEIGRLRKAETVTGKAIQWLRNHTADGDPYFLLVHYFDPHFFYIPPAEFQEAFGGSFTERIRAIEHPDDVREGKIALDAWDRECLENLYYGEVAYTDRELGRLLSFLRTEELLKDVVVIVTSDHGEEFWDHGGFEHGHSQYEELVRVPLLMRFPGGIPGGRAVETPVRLMDLMPTLHDYLGLSVPATFRGESFLGLAGGGEGVPDVPFYFENCLYGRDRKALRAGNLKLILDVDSGEAALFDLEKDPGEMQDLTGSHPEERDAMKAAILRIADELEEARTAEKLPADLSAETMESLKNLGYVGKPP